MTLTPKQVSDMNIVFGSSIAIGGLYLVGGIYYALKHQKGAVSVILVIGTVVTTGMVVGLVASAGLSITGIKIADIQAHMNERNNTNLVPSQIMNQERTYNV